jgi:hypothetical protein
VTARAPPILALALVAAAILAWPGKAGAQQWFEEFLEWEPLQAWDIRGSNTVRLEKYKVQGNDAASPFPFEDEQAFDELSLSGRRDVSAYEFWSARAIGLINLSDYRAQDRGFVPETLNLSHEKGDAGIPYRFELGDYLAFLSPRTVQLPLKGGQIEAQPAGEGDVRHSLQFMTGFNDVSYAEFDIGEDHYTGASWLMTGTVLGTTSLNWVNNYQEGSLTEGTKTRQQNVYSFAWERGLDVGTHRLTFEGSWRSSGATSPPRMRLRAGPRTAPSWSSGAPTADPSPTARSTSAMATISSPRGVR